MLTDAAIILFAIFLYIVCAVLMVMEIFIPSFGLLSLLALGAFLWGAFLFFQIGTTVGWVGLGTAIVVIPTFWIITYKVFPKTSLGRSMVLNNEPRPVGDAIAEKEQLAALVGKSGKTLGPLRPVGGCEIDGLRVACTAEVGFIPKGAEIEVIRVEGNTVTVRTKETTT